MLTGNRSQRKGSSSSQKKPDARRHSRPTVIPAKAGIQEDTAGLDSATLDSRLRGNDGETLAVNGYVDGRRGWRARYVKEVDASEATVRFWQEVYDSGGRLVEIHEKYPEDMGHRIIKE